jgi:FkbH-like protein
MPAPNDLRGRLAAAAQEADGAIARGLASQLWQTAPALATAGFLAKTLVGSPAAAQWPIRRVFVLRSFTVEPLVPLVVAEGLAAGVVFEVTAGDFNTYAQEILDPQSRLYASSPDFVILAVQTRDVAPDLAAGEPGRQSYADTVDRVSSEFSTLVRTFRERTAAPLLIHSLDLPSRPAGGIFDAQRPDGQIASIHELNRRLLSLVANVTDAYVLDYGGLVARHGSDAWHDPRMWTTSRLPLKTAHLGTLAGEWARSLLALCPPMAKAVVCDLDNTLWGGVVGEDGPDGITVGDSEETSPWLQIQRALLDLYHRGILLAISSKNNPDDALAVLERHPQMLLRPQHFAAMRISWDTKPQSLSEIAAELSVGRDTLVFLDDNPVEREYVRQAVPDARVIELPADPARYAAAIREFPLFERLRLTGEDRDRATMYAQQRQRAELEKSATSVEDYYRSLQMSLTIAPVTPDTLARASQLTQKTNQFNMTTRRYSEAEIAAFIAAPNWHAFTVQVRDRFGDNGIVGLIMARHEADAWRIDTFLLSCRVIGRTVETAMLAWLGEKAREAGASSLIGEFIPTKKNAPSAGVYAAHGFQAFPGSAPPAGVWSHDLRADTIQSPEWIEIIESPTTASAT